MSSIQSLVTPDQGESSREANEQEFERLVMRCSPKLAVINESAGMRHSAESALVDVR